MSRVSIGVPVWNDSAALARLLTQLRPAAGTLPQGVEVIVALAGPEDPGARTLRTANAWVTWVEAPLGRGPQMNAGAARASGEWLWFVHADSVLPRQWLQCFASLDRQPGVVGGSFAFGLDSAAWQARLLEKGVALRVRLFGLPYGDQGLFVRRQVFERMGGFLPIPLMEDVEFVGRLRREGPVRHLKERLVTSARRWEKEGWLRRSAGNLWTLVRYRLGAPPGALARKYYGKI